MITNLFQEDNIENISKYNNIHMIYYDIIYIYKILEVNYNNKNDKYMNEYKKFLNEIISNKKFESNIYLNYNKDYIISDCDIIYNELNDFFKRIERNIESEYFYNYCLELINLLKFNYYFDHKSINFIFKNINLILIFLLNIINIDNKYIYEQPELRNLIMYKIIYFI